MIVDLLCKNVFINTIAFHFIDKGINTSNPVTFHIITTSQSNREHQLQRSKMF